MKKEDVLVITYDERNANEAAICVMRKNGTGMSIVKVVNNNKARDLYRLLTDQTVDFDLIPHPYLGKTVRCGDGLYEVVECSNKPYLIFDDGSLHYGMTIQRIGGNPDDWLAVDDAQVEIVEE